MKTKTTNTPEPLTLKQITDGTPDCACKFVPGKLNLQRCPLHAAAPDLLEAAKRIVALSKIAAESKHPHWAALRAAIAKAQEVS